MKRALQAALLSGVVFPGLGQLWLKHYFRGAVLIVAVSASLGVVAMKAARQALGILERMEAVGSVDMVAVADMAARSSLAPDDLRTTTALLLLVLCWVIAIADAYLAGRRLDRLEQGKKPLREQGAPKEGRG